MTAELTKEAGSRPYVAWCEECQEGVRHHTTKAGQGFGLTITTSTSTKETP